MTEQDILRGFQHWFLALSDPKDPDARDRIADIVAAHLRSMANKIALPAGQIESRSRLRHGFARG